MKAPRYIDTNISNLVSNERSYLKHREKLIAIQSKRTIPKFDHMKVLRDNLRFRQNNFNFQEQQRLTSIQRENEILLTHLVKINGRKNSMRKLATTQSPTSRTHLVSDLRQNTPRTHHSILRQRDRERIAQENQIILRKLQEKVSKPASISRQDQEEAFRRHQLAKARLRRVQVHDDQSVAIRNRNYSMMVAQRGSKATLSPRYHLNSGFRDGYERDKPRLIPPTKRVNITADNITLNPGAADDRLNTSDIPETYNRNQILESIMIDELKTPPNHHHSDNRKVKLVPQNRPMYRSNSKSGPSGGDLNLSLNERKKFDSPYSGNAVNGKDLSSEETKTKATSQVSNLKFTRPRDPTPKHQVPGTTKGKENEESKYAIKIIEPVASKKSLAEKALSNSQDSNRQDSSAQEKRGAKKDNENDNLFSLTAATDGKQEQKQSIIEEEIQDSQIVDSEISQRDEKSTQNNQQNPGEGTNKKQTKEGLSKAEALQGEEIIDESIHLEQNKE